MAAIVGFKITVIDERSDFASAARFPDAAEVLAEDIPPLTGISISIKVGTSSS